MESYNYVLMNESCKFLSKDYKLGSLKNAIKFTSKKDAKIFKKDMDLHIKTIFISYIIIDLFPHIGECPNCHHETYKTNNNWSCFNKNCFWWSDVPFFNKIYIKFNLIKKILSGTHGDKL